MASGGSTTEALSVNRAFRAIRRSDVVALIIEAMACITEQVIFLLYNYVMGKVFISDYGYSVAGFVIDLPRIASCVSVLS